MPKSYHPVIHLPADYDVYDFTHGYDPNRPRKHEYGVGKYNEKRPGMYTEESFTRDRRDIHVGIDINAPVNCPVHAFDDGEIFLFGNNPAKGDYGYLLITRHLFEGKPLFALHGHLSAASVEGKKPGQKFTRGQVLAWVGDKHENGGWNPHLHFQLSLVEPEACDLPGVVSENQLAEALRIYPDPRIVLGPLY
jgi:murein DD-endopeptidase MepM/ murein hydrolase activator NlpD